MEVRTVEMLRDGFQAPYKNNGVYCYFVLSFIDIISVTVGEK